MSIVQSAYQTILNHFKDSKKMSQSERQQLLQQASSLMGRGFRQALNHIEQGQNHLTIIDYDIFYIMHLKNQKFILFKSNNKMKLNDCNCKNSWVRKVGGKAPYMCSHQILLELALHIFSDQIIIKKGDLEGLNQLGELFDFLN